MLVEINKHTI